MRRTTRRRLIRGVAAFGIAGLAGVGSATPGNGNDNGKDGSRSQFADEDDNGIADEGEVVTGRYKAIYAYDGSGDTYTYNLSNRRVEGGSVASVDDLDDETLTVCYYTVQYRGTFENDPYQDTGWIKNIITCKGQDKGSYSYLFVHESDPRYTGEKPVAFGGSWEYHVLTQSGAGNTVVTDTRPASGN
jgi:hypothetical protein